MVPFNSVLFFLHTDPDISPSENLPDKDPSMFHKRYLKWMKDLGEVSSNTASPQHFLYSCMLQSDALLIVLSPGTLRKGDSILV